uniref:Activin_recp domain-containing protein n=1 Tax=Strongyloides papillosus TaxID=174720 RepID=A0A0N5BL99_STREA
MFLQFITFILISEIIVGIPNITNKEVLASADGISCYYFSHGFNNIADTPITKVKCPIHDNCVKVVDQYGSMKGTWKGCSSQYFTANFKKLGAYYVPNTCISGEYIPPNGVTVQETLCGCDNKDLCNSGSKTSILPVSFAISLFFYLKTLLF